MRSQAGKLAQTLESTSAKWVEFSKIAVIRWMNFYVVMFVCLVWCWQGTLHVAALHLGF
jgi:hypothetical protein